MGHAKDYVFAMWKILQQKKPDDFVIATKKQYSIKDFINLVAKQLKLELTWKGKGINEKRMTKIKDVLFYVVKNILDQLKLTLFLEIQKAIKNLKWKPKYKINLLIKEMIVENLRN